MPIALCILSCLPVVVNALAAPDARSQTRFEIAPATARIERDLMFQELAGEAGRALTAGGFEPAEAAMPATVSVKLTWRVGRGARRGKRGAPADYARTIILKAYDLTAPGKGRAKTELWEAALVSEGPDDDMRTVAPVMFAAAAPYLAQNTGKAISVGATPKRDMIRYIHGEIASPPPLQK